MVQRLLSRPLHRLAPGTAALLPAGYLTADRNTRMPGWLGGMHHSHPPIWHAVAFFAAIALVLYLVWGPY
jgi:hypothetical protein